VFDAELGKIKTVVRNGLAISKGSLQRTANDISVVNILRIEREESRGSICITTNAQSSGSRGVIDEFDLELGKIKTVEMVSAISKGSLQRTGNDISVINILRIERERERERNFVGIFASQQCTIIRESWSYWCV
jgi:hypothetical protein